MGVMLRSLKNLRSAMIVLAMALPFLMAASSLAQSEPHTDRSTRRGSPEQSPPKAETPQQGSKNDNNEAASSEPTSPTTDSSDKGEAGDLEKPLLLALKPELPEAPAATPVAPE